MPLPGGAADKIGNRYESIWTVRCMIDVLSARFDSIRLEPPGVEGEGIEFWLKKGDLLEYHQVKRQNSPTGNWTIADLDNKGVLKHLWGKLQSSSASFVFVSTNSAYQIEELSERSKCSASFTEFRADFMKAKSVYDIFGDLCKRWNNCSEQEAYAILRRIEIEITSERNLRSNVERELGSLIDGNTANAVDVLAQFALDKIHHELSPEDIWKHLENRNFVRHQKRDTGLFTGDFGWTVPSYFIGRAEILEELTYAINQNSIVVVGGLAGIGKTYLVSKYIDNLDSSRKVLWIDCGTYNQIEKVLVRLAEFFSYICGDETLLNFLKNPLGSLERQIEIAAKVCDKYQCILVWDNFDPEKHETLLSLFHECNRIFRTGKLLITTRTSVDFTTAINLPYKIIVPALTKQFGIELMRHYLVRLGLEIYPDEILAQAHERVDGHPYFLRSLVVLSEAYPLPDILKSLPQLPSQIKNYLQEQVFNHLTEGANRLITNLSVLQTPFTLAAINKFDTTFDAMMSFEILLKKFLVIRTAKNSVYYEIHDLVREYGESQLTIEQKKNAHTMATDYYDALEPKMYNDLAAIINHALEANLPNRANEAANTMVDSALYEGLFDLVIDLTSQLFEDERVFEDKQAKNWSKIHFARGRALRLKRNFSDALKSYENALQYAHDDHFIEIIKLEIASILALQVEHNRTKNIISKAKKLYAELIDSKKVEIQVAALGCLGYLNTVSEQLSKGIDQLNKGLKLAEKAQLKRDIRQICQSLGAVYTGKDNEKAIQYLERAYTLQQETHPQYGNQDVDIDYFLFEALANVYNAQMRFEDAVRVSEKCVAIDRKLNLEERLALSLFQLGKDNCYLKRFERARNVLQEGLSLIRKLNLHGKPETSTLVWLTTALWYSGQFELAIETMLEYIFLNQHVNKIPLKHVVFLEKYLMKDVEIDYYKESVHVLILPKMYNENNLKQWNQRIVNRRPELGAVNFMSLK